jgi:hypothetical protein
MHALHAILVCIDDAARESWDIEDLKHHARVVAMSATEDYAGRVFDWRTEEHAGRFSDEFPGQGVVLGKEEPERLVELVKTYSRKPLEKALYYLNHAITRPGWYPKEEITAKGLRVLDETPVYAPDGRAFFQAGRALTQLQIDSDFLLRAWEGDADALNTLWCLRQALTLIGDEYTFDSHFYSVPDGSPKLSTETFVDLTEHPEYYALVFSDYHY